jgi:hypothetical protein
MTAFDVLGLAVAAVMCVLPAGRGAVNLGRLKVEEPSASDG